MKRPLLPGTHCSGPGRDRSTHYRWLPPPLAPMPRRNGYCPKHERFQLPPVHDCQDQRFGLRNSKVSLDSEKPWDGVVLCLFQVLKLLRFSWAVPAWSGISKPLRTSRSSCSRMVPRREVSSSRKASTTWSLRTFSL